MKYCVLLWIAVVSVSCSNHRPYDHSQDWILIHGGTFIMGSPEHEIGRDENEFQHEVTLTRDFEILATEVTRGQFIRLMDYDPRPLESCNEDRCPINDVNWHESAAYCNALSHEADLDWCYSCGGSDESVRCTLRDDYETPYDCPGYRLPTEAEWEYAARAGTITATYNGDNEEETPDSCEFCPTLDPIAWYCDNSGGFMHQTGQLQPNTWGLFDILGNVHEWCHDWYIEIPDWASTDPWGPTERTEHGEKVIRGGFWNGDYRMNRAAARGAASVNSRHSSQGLRPVRTIFNE